ncbi:hypothetical protein ACEWY4_007858 [Coilia grayii]|uniref:Uncharacterized protein n=1 Tax=Coilia grayii TaxID=363190 RepID=A0ABD1K989_9TELE
MESAKEKPLPLFLPGGFVGILGVVVVAGLIIGVIVTICMVYRRNQKPRTETDNDLTDLPPAHKPAPPPPKKKGGDPKGHDDIQVVHLDKDEEMQKLPLQPPYYDMAPSESTAFTDKGLRCPVCGAGYCSFGLRSQPEKLCSHWRGPGRNAGSRLEELSAPAEYVSYHHACNQDHRVEIPPSSAYTPITLLPQNPYPPQPPNPPMYTFSPNPPPAPRPPYTFPKEQSV